MTDKTKTVREAVGVFHVVKDMQEAIDELCSSNFDRADVSLLAGEAAIQEKLGHIYEKVQDLEDAPDSPRICYISEDSIGDAEGWLIGGPLYVAAVTAAGMVVASGGTLAAVIGATAVAGGMAGFIGSIFAEILDRHHAEYLEKQLEKGGILLWVRTHDSAHEARATAILKKHSGEDVHVHTLPAP